MRLRPTDLGILAASAILAAWLCVVTDREFMATYGLQPSWDRAGQTWLPPWLKERRNEAIRLVHGGTAILAACGLGLGVVALRHRNGRRFAVPFGPGAIASVLTGVSLLIHGIAWGVRLALDPPSPPPVFSSSTPGPYPLGGYLDLYRLWGDLRAEVTLMILGAWCTLAATGRWRRAEDASERLGRWLAAGWFLLIVGQAAIFVIAWS